MSRKPIVLIVVLCAAILASCGLPAASTPSLDSQIQTAIVATVAFQATVAALPPTPTPGPQVYYYTLSEEELSALIDQAVAEALAASNQSSASTTAATSDGTVTSDEIYTTITYIYDAQAEIEYAEELITYYLELYGDYASEVLDTLTAVEEDLDSIAAGLDEMVGILKQGAETASAALDQLNQTASELQTKAGETQTQAQAWLEQVKSSIQTRENSLLSMSPTEIATDRDGAIQQMYTYLDTLKAAMGDNKISPSELTQIAQLAANAKASIQAQGGPALQNVAGNIDGLTRQLARGEWQQARSGLGGFEASLPQRP